MRENRYFDKDGSTFENMFKQVIDSRVDDFLVSKTNGNKGGNSLNDL